MIFDFSALLSLSSLPDQVHFLLIYSSIFYSFSVDVGWCQSVLQTDDAVQSWYISKTVNLSAIRQKKTAV